MTNFFSNIFNEFKQLKKIHCGKLIKAVVISINKNFILVDSGLKSESKISINEFVDNNNLLNINIGDEIDVILDSMENGFGKTILSREKAKIYYSWINLKNFYKNKSIVIGKVIEKVKGGFIILVENIKAFLPGSLIDFKSMNSDLKGKDLELKIIKLDKKNNNIVLSRKAVFQINNLNNKEEFLEKLKINSIMNGVVKNITDYGAFIDLGFVDGLLHITDMTWKRIKHPSEIVKLGDDIKIKVLNFDKNTLKISLGLKQLSIDPWINIDKKYSKNEQISGKVTNITDYGFFVEIENGIEGLVHTSEIDIKYQNLHPTKIVQLNQIVKVTILNIDENSRRISLRFKNF